MSKFGRWDRRLLGNLKKCFAVDFKLRCDMVLNSKTLKNWHYIKLLCIIFIEI